jgi:hypothetical protein
VTLQNKNHRMPHTCDRIENSGSSLMGKGEIYETRGGPLD